MFAPGQPRHLIHTYFRAAAGARKIGTACGRALSIAMWSERAIRSAQAITCRAPSGGQTSCAV